jgi:hypothetical protein
LQYLIKWKGYSESDNIWEPASHLSLPLPGTNWADWSNALGREMYLRRVLDRLNLEYPSNNGS